MSLTTPFSVQKLQTALHVKAKESPNLRFHALYDKVYRKDVLAYAYERCKANGGAAGVDSQTFENIEAYGRERWLDELTQELKSRIYQPQPVRRVYIPKPDGKQRPLGIPTIRDRVVQTSAMLVLEPIFEADLPTEQYAYPLRYPDSMSYLEDGRLVARALFLRKYSANYGFRSFIYCLGILPFHWNVTPWPIVALQALADSVCHLARRTVSPAAANRAALPSFSSCCSACSLV